MSLANKITIGRATFIVPIILTLLVGLREIALGLFLIASAGDVMDGAIARSRNEVSKLGKILDPAVDKILYASLVVSLYVMGAIPLVWLILFFVPQLGLALGALFLHFSAGEAQGARILGKLASVLTFVAMSLLIIDVGPGVILFAVAVGVTYAAGVDYLVGAMRILNQH
jgi:phosphatidylglycerophosphate synthase